MINSWETNLNLNTHNTHIYPFDFVWITESSEAKHDRLTESKFEGLNFFVMMASSIKEEVQKWFFRLSFKIM